MPYTEDKFTMAPCPLALSAGSAAREGKYVPVRLVSTTRSHSAGAGARSRPSGRTPAELMSVLSTVNLATTWSTIRSHALASVTSVSIANASPPAALITRVVSFARSPIRSTHATRAPSAPAPPPPPRGGPLPRRGADPAPRTGEDPPLPAPPPRHDFARHGGYNRALDNARGGRHGLRVLEEDEDVLGADHRLHEQVHL